MRNLVFSIPILKTLNLGLDWIWGQYHWISTQSGFSQFITEQEAKNDSCHLFSGWCHSHLHHNYCSADVFFLHSVTISAKFNKKLRWFPHNLRTKMAKIKLLPKNPLSMVIFWIKVRRSCRELSSQADPTRENWTWSYPYFSLKGRFTLV